MHTFQPMGMYTQLTQLLLMHFSHCRFTQPRAGRKAELQPKKKSQLLQENRGFPTLLHSISPGKQFNRSPSWCGPGCSLTCSFARLHLWKLHTASAEDTSHTNIPQKCCNYTLLGVFPHHSEVIPPGRRPEPAATQLQPLYNHQTTQLLAPAEPDHQSA